MEDSLTFGKKYGQTGMRSENDLNKGTTRKMTLHHLYDDTVLPKTFPVQTNDGYLNYQ